MIKKKSVIWRVALLLLALTVATTSFTLTRAKYYYVDQEISGEIKVFQIISIRSSSDFAPAGRYAYYARGQTGANSGGLPGEMMGIFVKDADGSFVIGTAAGGAGDKAGGNGGDARYIFDAEKKASIGTADSNKTGIVVVAAGGGACHTDDNHRSLKGGDGGGAGSATHNNGTNGVINGWRGECHSGADATSDHNRHCTSSQNTTNCGRRGGGGGSETTGGAIGGNGGGISTGWTPSIGGWFSGGQAQGGTTCNIAACGGGAGLYGGGPGGIAQALDSESGMGGGGSSYAGACAGAAGAGSTAAGASYEDHALAYFQTLVKGVDLEYALVWLGP